MNEHLTASMSLLEKCLYYFIFSIVYVISLLPLSFLYIISDVLYLLFYKVASYRAKLVRKNLRDSFPDKSDAQLMGIEKKFYHFLCDYIVETIKLASMSRGEMLQRVHYSGVEHIIDCYNEGHNVAIYLGHYCNWEWITSIGLHVPKDIFGGQVYHILENKVLNALLLKLRSSMGTHSVSMQLILRKTVECKRAGIKMIIGFISDQSPLSQATNYFTTFLNHENTPFITGTEVIAKKFDYACVYFDISRPRRGYYDINIIPMGHSDEYEEWQLTEAYARLMESSIRRNPEYWLWTHNRWKRGTKEFCEWVNTSGKATKEQKELAEKLRGR